MKNSIISSFLSSLYGTGANFTVWVGRFGSERLLSEIRSESFPRKQAKGRKVIHESQLSRSRNSRSGSQFREFWLQICIGFAEIFDRIENSDEQFHQDKQNETSMTLKQLLPWTCLERIETVSKQGLSWKSYAS